MRIGPIDLDRRVLVVAEVGNNHEGRLDVAVRLVHAAADCGVDAVKFQTFRVRSFANPADRPRYERLRTFELSDDAFRRLQDEARSRGLLFLSTPLDMESVALLTPLVDAFKIASGDNDFYPLMARVCDTAKPVIVSSGLSDLAQMRATVRFIRRRWRTRKVRQEVAVLHCVSAYPAPDEELNLAAIPSMARALRCPIGYSDHGLGIGACVAAVALGARIVEKHFTLDHDFSDFRDHRLSVEPAEMRQLVELVRRVSLMSGSAEKAVQPSEATSAQAYRRSVVAAADFAAGHRLVRADLTWMRPATGVRPGRERLLIGRRLVRTVTTGEPLQESDVE
jgi:sialic acid synthase SpsE